MFAPWCCAGTFFFYWPYPDVDLFMKKFAIKLILSIIALVMTVLNVSADSDKQFFHKIEGRWTGPGQVIAGKFKGTKFTCDFAGSLTHGEIGLMLDGTCRMGVFSHPMRASIIRTEDGFKGAFNDGAAGEGLDVVSGQTDLDHMVFALNRKELKGAMMARLADENSMNITVSVKVQDNLIPVIGMKLKRTVTDYDIADR